jgi:beta-N-acetylhexosaminidase
VASNYAYAYAAGLADGGVLPVAKHFPGEGRSSEDIHVRAASVTVSLDALQSSDLRPFDALIRAGIPAVIMNHLRYSSLDPSLPASLSPRAYQLLRGLGFRGAAITDSVGMGAVNQTWDVAEASVRAVTAGADGVLNTGGETAKDMRHGLVAAVLGGKLDESRLDEAASRIVALAGGDPRTVTCTTGDWRPSGDFAPRRGQVATPAIPSQPGRDQTQLAPVVASPEVPLQR